MSERANISFSPSFEIKSFTGWLSIGKTEVKFGSTQLGGGAENRRDYKTKQKKTHKKNLV